MRILKFVPALALLLPAFAFAGTQTYSTPGTYTFTVPQYTGTLTVQASGGGGGGMGGQGGSEPQNAQVAGESGEPGTSGGSVSFGTVIANGGGGGGDPVVYGAPGTASGGDTNIVGGGAAGGAGGDGGWCMGCGWGTQSEPIGAGGTSGGNGGRAVKSYNPSQLAPGTTVTVVIKASQICSDRWCTERNGGLGGSGGSCTPDPTSGMCYTSGANGENGENGSVVITWTDAPPPPSCSVTFDQNPIEKGNSTTIHWTSNNATLFYINNVGYVGASGSAQLSPAITTDFSGTVTSADGTTASCAASLTVNCTPDGTYSCSDSTHRVDSCGNISACSAGQTCSGGVCSNACTPDGTLHCSGTQVLDSCNVPQSDCAATGRICAAGGVCQCPSGSTWDGTACVTACTGGQVWNGSACVCPAGSVWDGTQCVASSCTGGRIWNGSACVCPSGTTWDGSSCINSCTGGRIWNGSACVCPTGQSWSGSQCACPAGQSWNGTACVVVCTPSYFCSGSNLYHQNASCVNSLVQACAYGCTNNACNTSPSPALNFSVIPLVVHNGDTTAISWSAQNVTSCTVTGSNGDGWSGISGTKTSSAITGQTIYTIRCNAVGGSTLEQSKTVNIIPVFCEPGVPGC